jgi:hypothetical protein
LFGAEAGATWRFLALYFRVPRLTLLPVPIFVATEGVRQNVESTSTVSNFVA